MPVVTMTVRKPKNRLRRFESEIGCHHFLCATSS